VNHRRAVVGAMIAIAMSVVAACGFQAPAVQDDEHASVQATDFHVGTLTVSDTSITQVTAADGTSQLYLTATIVNVGARADALTGLSTPGGSITLGGVGPVAGRLAIPPGVPVEIGAPSVTSPGPTAAIDVSPPPVVGGYLPVTFTFAIAGPMPGPVQVPVVPAGETTAPTQPVPTATASLPTQVGESASD
jgi:hypothetical protein